MASTNSSTLLNVGNSNSYNPPVPVGPSAGPTIAAPSIAGPSNVIAPTSTSAVVHPPPPPPAPAPAPLNPNALNTTTTNTLSLHESFDKMVTAHTGSFNSCCATTLSTNSAQLNSSNQNWFVTSYF